MEFGPWPVRWAIGAQPLNGWSICTDFTLGQVVIG